MIDARRTETSLFVGDDWSGEHHDVEIQDGAGRKLAARRLPEGAAGIARLHELIAAHLNKEDDPGQLVLGIETDRGLWVQALAAAGYQVFGLNPRQVAPFKRLDDRELLSGIMFVLYIHTAASRESSCRRSWASGQG